MASNKDFVVKQAQQAALTNKPQPVLPRTAPDSLRKASEAAWKISKK